MGQFFQQFRPIRYRIRPLVLLTNNVNQTKQPVAQVLPVITSQHHSNSGSIFYRYLSTIM